MASSAWYSCSQVKERDAVAPCSLPNRTVHSVVNLMKLVERETSIEEASGLRQVLLDLGGLIAAISLGDCRKNQGRSGSLNLIYECVQSIAELRDLDGNLG
jgi:hypothetical protein